jgi:hypothetical protein
VCAAALAMGADLRDVRGIDNPVSSIEIFPPELVHLIGTARQVIDQHVNDHGTCACCGLAWPCERARLADLALAAP